MILRKEQLNAFDRRAESAFETSVRTHLHKFFPQTCARLGKTELDAVVNEGLERARHYGIASGPDIALFLDMMFLFGRQFDQDPAHRWAASILTASISPHRKMEMLFSAGGERLDRSKGLDGRTAPDAR
jgi:hypothetical protein